ncbi:S-adenosyl-L-methionine-dependent methyltransferase [Sporodiniella umbellata]|nr:S-adenosyl-L-methionine-dependent methyltransferase [Sporodiniella umbellata]
MRPTPESVVTNREFHNVETSTYWLPKDRDELDRLTGQHFIFKEILKGNVSSSVKETIDFKKGAAILDVGCGSGVWSLDMSSDYPNCTYNSCDIIDTPELLRKQKKVKYAYGNVIQGLPYDDNTFDFVYMRLFICALRAEEWPMAIDEVIRVTKPGGMVQFVDITCIPPTDTNSHCYKGITAMNNFCIERGQLPNVAYELENLVLTNQKARISQSYHTHFRTNNGTDVAKKFAWDAVKALGGMMNYLGHQLGVHSKEEISEFLTRYKKDMFEAGFTLLIVSLSIKKTEVTVKNSSVE